MFAVGSSASQITFVLDLKDKELLATGELDESQSRDMVLAWAVGSTSTSNTITLVKGNRATWQWRWTAGSCELPPARHQTSRRRRALHKDAVAYSDSFFPFPDVPEVGIEPTRGVNPTGF